MTSASIWLRVGRGWVDTGRFDIDAKTGSAVPEAASRLMLRTLLAERFKLAVHREKRSRPVFLMTVVKKGSKLRESAADSTERSRCVGTGPITCYKRTMAQFADLLARISSGTEIPVIDETGLRGRYDFKLTFASSAADGVTLFDALQQQLGLKLRSAKRPIEFLVIDRARSDSYGELNRRLELFSRMRCLLSCRKGGIDADAATCDSDCVVVVAGANIRRTPHARSRG